ncbi:hypothetical protein [Mesorhizobium sp. LSJC280B00]|uniref:hypothetical protein n=1 Tax=Mesorhizobium sp. LSJC280B00 TaxID=1287336 RepID=UPI0003CDF32B|nr:hypothetical protein [Mesorhizobium sp. LSJC280B00]ESW78999.1 hypothetical protein X772_28440 [Mesorhizobium sp. LSJC280B00]
MFIFGGGPGQSESIIKLEQHGAQTLQESARLPGLGRCRGHGGEILVAIAYSRSRMRRLTAE